MHIRRNRSTKLFGTTIFKFPSPLNALSRRFSTIVCKIVCASLPWYSLAIYFRIRKLITNNQLQFVENNYSPSEGNEGKKKKNKANTVGAGGTITINRIYIKGLTSTMLSMTSVVKAANYILSRPTLSKIVTPIANKFTAYAGYREMGLKYVFMRKCPFQ